jgi:hypothetical protein
MVVVLEVRVGVGFGERFGWGGEVK